MKAWFKYIIFWGGLRWWWWRPWTVNSEWCTKHFPRWRHWEIITSANAEMFLTECLRSIPKAWRVHCSWLLGCLCASLPHCFGWGCFGLNQHAETMDPPNFVKGPTGETREEEKNCSFLNPIVKCKLLSEMTAVFSFFPYYQCLWEELDFLKWITRNIKIVCIYIYIYKFKLIWKSRNKDFQNLCR